MPEDPISNSQIFPDGGNDPLFGEDAFSLLERLIHDDFSRESAGAPADFGPYHFLEHLGSGALGEVWKAEERGALGQRLVAVKVQRKLGTRDLAVNEIQTLMDFNHPAIVRLYDHGVLADGTPWMATEVIEGGPLNRRNAGSLSLGARLKLFGAICNAVGYAHSQRVDHGDLKPSNILLTPEGTPKLIDFGIARRLAEGEEDNLPILGYSLAYAAPERIRHARTGLQADIYSLGGCCTNL